MTELSRVLAILETLPEANPNRIIVDTVVIERPFFEMKAVKRRHATRNAYEKKLESFVKSITEAAKARTTDKNIGIEMSVFQETNVNLVRDRDCSRLPIAHGISIPIVEPGDELTQMFLDLRMDRVLTWTKINLLHDRVFERDTIGRVLGALFREIPKNSHLGLASHSLFSTQFTNHSLSTRKHMIYETLSNFPPRRRSDDRFLVIVNHDIVPTIIKSARSLSMLHPESQWLFILPDSDPSNVTGFNRLLAEGENVAFIYNATKFDENCRLGLECHAKEMVGSLAASVEKAFKQEIELYERVTEEEFDAIRMTKAERCQQIIAFIREDLYNGKIDKKRMKNCDDCMIWKMRTGITWGKSFDRKNETERHDLIDVGYWTPGPGSSSKDLLFPHTKYGFRMKALPIVTFHNPPWQYVTKSTETGELKWDGLVFDIVDELSKKLNFTYKLVELGTITTQQKSGTEKSEQFANRTDARVTEKEFVRASTSSGHRIPDAVTERVYSGKVFMAACASTINERLKSSINFTTPISVQIYGLIATRPKPLSRAMLFASPYTTESWACLAGGILAIGPILYLVHRYSPSHTRQSGSTGLDSPARCLWYIYGALLQQGGMHLPDNDGARLIVGTWWLVVMVVVATYSGSLVAFLTFPRMHESISTVDDLLRHKDTLTWSLPAKSFLVDYLTSGKSDPYDGLLGDDERLAERHDSTNYEMIVDRVKEGKHVIVDWTSSLRMLTRMDNPLTDDGICHFSIGNEEFVEEPIALILPLDSPYLNLVNNELKRMNERGLIVKWTTDRMPMKDQCWEGSSISNQVNNHKVDVWDMQGIFFVLFLGYLIALVFLALEFFAHHRILAKERKIIRPFLS